MISKIARQLQDAPLPGSRNRISSDELKRWAAEYLDDYDEELAQFPKLVGLAHWNLWMIDSSRADALFAVLVFHPNGLEFFCGTGDSSAIQDFSEQEVFDDPAAMAAAMRQQFRIPEPSVAVDRASAEEWLGRSW